MRFGALTGIRTSEALLEALEKSAARPLSHERMEEQRISFVMGALDDDNDMTREQVERVLENQGRFFRFHISGRASPRGGLVWAR
jgi:hypothetical protein